MMDEKKNDRKTQRERQRQKEKDTKRERERQTGSRKQTDRGRGRHKVHRVMEIKRDVYKIKCIDNDG